MLYISPQLCIVLFLLLPIGGSIIGRVSKRLKSQSTDNSQRIGNLLSIVEETLSGLRVIKAFRAESRLRAQYEQENDHLFHLNNKIAKRRELASPMSETLAILILVIILMYGGKLVLVDQSIDAGTFIMFILVFTQLIDPLKKFSQIFYNIQKGAASLERINAILKAENRIPEKENALSIRTLEKGIVFQNVNFHYGDKKILDNINIQIPRGKMIALVGASGSGKSTLVDLIPRFHDAASGEIRIDDISIADLKIADLRGLIGYVGQEPILFNDTISSNIALGAAPDQASVEKAAKIALAHDFILRKENAYETNIGDRGAKLSGGERQRLTIARAVYKDPPILILDEATSSLDTESERYVQEALVNLMKDRTTIVIAHRLSTVQNADHIYVLQNGKIIEEGNHQSLLQFNSYYKKLVEMQQL
jgi:subfamily B ATP-binding cassette protein MsbA